MSKEKRSGRRERRHLAKAKKRAFAEAAAARRAGLMPVLGGVIIDVADFVTLGGLGGVGGAIVGGLITYGVCSQQGTSKLNTAAFTAIGAIYCALPFTEALPLATLLALITQLVPSQRALPAAQPEPAIDPVRVSQLGRNDPD